MIHGFEHKSTFLGGKMIDGEELIRRVLNNTPRDLLDQPAWCLVKITVVQGEKKPRKLPMYADGKPRGKDDELDSKTDRAKLVPFAWLQAALRQMNADTRPSSPKETSYVLPGLALGVLPNGQCISCIDFDDIAANGIKDIETDAINAAQTYTEISCSRLGSHILGTGDIGTLATKNGIEFFNGKRTLAFTGELKGSFTKLSDIREVAQQIRSKSAAKTARAKHAVGEGNRNNALNREVYIDVKADCFDADEIRQRAHAINDSYSPPLPADEVEKLVDSKLKKAGIAPPQPPEPLPEVREDQGAEILETVLQFVRKYVAYPSDNSAYAHVLWIVHAHLMRSWETTPRLHFQSAEPGSGKTRALEVTALLVPNPVQHVSQTANYLYRKLTEDPDNLPTLLLDEIDTVFGPNAREHEDLRAFINAGHAVDQTAGRCVVGARKVTTEELRTFSAVALAGLGGLPDSISSRCIRIPMRRRAPRERVQPFRRRTAKREAAPIKAHVAAWCQVVGPQIQELVMGNLIIMPSTVTDRPADVWEPLFAVANAAGGDWPSRAEAAAVSLLTDARGAEKKRLALRLLSDCRTVFGTDEGLYSQALVERLVEGRGISDETMLDDGAPWADMNHKGRKLDVRALADLLGEYGIKSTKLRLPPSGKSLNGYYRSSFDDSWARYLQEPEQPERQNRGSQTPIFIGKSGVLDNQNHTGTGQNSLFRPVPDGSSCAGSPTNGTAAAEKQGVVPDEPAVLDHARNDDDPDGAILI